MNLNRKIVLLLFFGMTLYTAVGFVFHRYLILPSFAELEREEGRKDMRRCLEALDSHIAQMASLCYDWAAWDETYDFVVNPTSAYEEDNLYPSWFIDNDMNVMYFLRGDGSVAWGQYFDLKAGVPTQIPEFDGRPWPPDHPLLSPTDRASQVRGLLRTSRGPMLIVSRPILPSEAVDGETAHGTLIMGRLLDDDILNSIRQKTQVAVDIIDLEKQPMPDSGVGLKPDEIRVLPDSDEVLRVVTHTHDIEGHDALALEATIPRRIMARGESAIRLDMLAAAIAGFAFVLLLLVSMKWMVSDPLQRLCDHVRGVGFSKGMEPAPMAGRADEIGDVAREFNGMIARLQAEEAELKAMNEKVVRNQHLAQIGEMGATVAHEIRNPLAGIKGALQIISTDSLDKTEREAVLLDVHGLIDRISGTVEQLLKYSKSIEPVYESISLRSLIDSVRQTSSVQPPKGVSVQINCDGDLLIQADLRLFRQVLENIWANACQAAVAPGHIEWTVLSVEQHVELRLFNTGSPIPEADLKRVFEPFFTTRVEGSGLGLAVTRRIVEAHDGEVYIAAGEDRGVTVIVRMPQGE